MKPELEFQNELDNDDSKPNDTSDELDRCYVSRTRPSEANGFAVYTRSRRLKTKIRATANADSAEGSSGVSGGEMMEVEVKEEDLMTTAAVTAAVSTPTRRIRNGANKRFTRSVVKSKDEEEIITEELKEVVELDGESVPELDNTKSPKNREMKMSKKVLLRGRPTTVRELFETGLLEGYPVFYNGGKRGFRLRGTIKDDGILCSCSTCKGNRIVPPCQFEIHACKAYRRASQYICLENGKSLLDVVKECRKSSVKTLEETIENFVGPLPVKEPVFCRNCEGSFLATSAGKEEQLCDSCMIILNSEIDPECLKSRPLEPLLGLTMTENGEVHNSPQKKGHRGRKKRKHSELMASETPSARTSSRLSRKKGLSSVTKMLSESASILKSPKSAPVRNSRSSDLVSNSSPSLHGSVKNKTTKRIVKKKMSKLNVGSPSVSSAQSKSPWKITKKDQTMHKLVFETGGLPDGTEVSYYSNGKKLRDGYKMGSGIICRCCSTLVSPSTFEAHAGWASRRKPYMYIYTSNGVSLHEYAVSLLKGPGRKLTSKENDDLCIICADGGKLVLCDGCPRAFHKECASLSSIPRGKWFCTYCQNMFQRENFVHNNANAVAAGRVSGIDPIEQITNRCIRIVKNPDEAEVIACVICRGYDFSKTGFGPRTVILCDQCEKEYHVGCLKKSKMAELKELPKGKWFCSVSCKRIYSALQTLLSAGEEKLPDSSLDAMRNKQAESSQVDNTNVKVTWRLLNGKIRSRETRVLLSQAVAIFHDSFDPIVDSETGRDFIPSMVYGRNIRGQDFSGMYCALLTVNSTVVSAGIIRIFGEEIAELPLAATRTGNQGKGYFQTLFSCIEKLLAFLNVKNFVLPATDEATSIWTEKFGFRKIPREQLLDYRRICWQMITFKGTSMLERTVPKCRIIDPENEAESDAPLQ